MIKTALLVLPFVLSAGQVPPDVTAKGKAAGASDECVTVAVPPKCQKASRLTINANTKKVSPPNMCVQVGKSFQVNVVPDSASARIVSKDGATWLSGEGESFSIEVPASALGPHDYAVYFENGSCIDPQIFGLD